MRQELHQAYIKNFGHPLGGDESVYTPSLELVKRFKQHGLVFCSLDIGFGTNQFIVDVGSFPNLKYAWLKNLNPSSLRLVISAKEVVPKKAHGLVTNPLLTFDPPDDVRFLEGIMVELDNAPSHRKHSPYNAMLLPLYRVVAAEAAHRANEELEPPTS